MKISYKFLDGKHTEVEVADAIGAVIVDSRRVENSAERKHYVATAIPLMPSNTKAKNMAPENSPMRFATMPKSATKKSGMLFPISARYRNAA